MGVDHVDGAGRQAGGDGSTDRSTSRSDRDRLLGRVLRTLQGRRVALALADGDRLDDCDLISVPRDENAPLWLYAGGTDRFVARGMIVDAWEVAVP